jgi:hypothetical protein
MESRVVRAAATFLCCYRVAKLHMGLHQALWRSMGRHVPLGALALLLQVFAFLITPSYSLTPRGSREENGILTMMGGSNVLDQQLGINVHLRLIGHGEPLYRVSYGDSHSLRPEKRQRRDTPLFVRDVPALLAYRLTFLTQRAAYGERPGQARPGFDSPLPDGVAPWRGLVMPLGPTHQRIHGMRALNAREWERVRSMRPLIDQEWEVVADDALLSVAA